MHLDKTLIIQTSLNIRHFVIAFVLTHLLPLSFVKHAEHDWKKNVFTYEK